MKTNSQKTNKRICFWAAIGLALMLLATCPQGAVAQSNTFPSSGDVGIGTTIPAVALEVAQNKAIRLGNANISSGGDYVHIGNHAWYNGSAWQHDGTVGGLYQISGQTHNWHKHDGSGTFTNMMTINPSGNVGIGTASPIDRLHVKYPAATNAIPSFESSDRSILALGLFQTQSSARDYGAYFVVAANTADFKLVRRANNFDVDVMTVLNANGNVGIGTAPSANKLDVNGNTNVTGNLNASGTITGGTINAKYQDVAEWVESSQILPAATVVVLDHTKSNQVVASTQAYDTRVAGVISAQPGITLGENGAGKVLVATTGRLMVKVDATRAPIQVGDLLVAGDREGFAMKSLPVNIGGVKLHRPGTLIGKALEPLAKGTGEILVLLSLQ